MKLKCKNDTGHLSNPNPRIWINPTLTQMSNPCLRTSVFVLIVDIFYMNIQ